MPKKGRKAKGSGTDSVKFPFHYCTQTALVGGSFTFNANPSGLSPRALIEADAWAHFRLVRLAFRLHPASTAASNQSQIVGFCGGVEDTPPTTFVQVGELLPSTVIGADATVPTEWVNVSKSELAGPFPWYKSIPGTADPTEESPGIVVVAGNTTEAFCVEIRGVFEFKTSVAAANTPLAVAARTELRKEKLLKHREVERKALLKVLGSTTLLPVPTP